MKKQVGYYSFIIGVILAVVLGLVGAYLGAATVWLMSLLVVLGLLVGFLNVAGKDTKDFLLVATVLVIAAFAGGASITLGSVLYIGEYLAGVFGAIMAFFVPALVIVGLKEVYALGKV